MSTLEIRDLGLQLPPADRALIARDLLASLDEAEPAEEVEAAWIEEIEARAEAYEAGTARAEDWEVSLERVREREARERERERCRRSVGAQRRPQAALGTIDAHADLIVRPPCRLSAAGYIG